jgi:predicted PurR-regulated permease PerM
MNQFRNPDLFLFVLIVAFTLIAFVVLWSVMDMVLLGASLAVVLLPVHHYISRLTLSWISALIVTIGVFLISVIIAYITAIILLSNASSLTGMFSTISVWLNNPSTNPMTYGVPFTKATLTSILTDATALFVDYQKTLISSLTFILFKMFVFFFSLFILLAHGEEIKGRLVSRVPATFHSFIKRLSAITVDTLYTIYIVQIAIAVLTFFIAIPVFYVLGYGNILFYSFLAAFCELIPILGSSVAFILIGAYALALGDTRGVFILFILGYLIVSCLPEIYVRPVLVGRRVKINPVIMFIGIIGGLLTMGLAGFVLGPVIIVLIITSYRLYFDEQKERAPSPVLSDKA